MKFKAFALRNIKELLREPLLIIFGIGLPLVLMIIIGVINNSIPQEIEIFNIENFAPGIAIFSLSFTCMFTGILVAKDRCSSYLQRLFSSPLSSFDYVLGYMIPMLPFSICQNILCFIVAFFFGLPIAVNVLLVLIVLIPITIFFIALGFLLGTLCSDKSVSPVCSIIVQLTALSSGMWFDLNMIGGPLKVICFIFPFAHAYEATTALLCGNSVDILNILVTIAYAIAMLIISVFVFKRKMKK